MMPDHWETEKKHNSAFFTYTTTAWMDPLRNCKHEPTLITFCGKAKANIIRKPRKSLVKSNGLYLSTTVCCSHPLQCIANGVVFIWFYSHDVVELSDWIWFRIPSIIWTDSNYYTTLVDWRVKAKANMIRKPQKFGRHHSTFPVYCAAPVHSLWNCII